MPEKEQNAKIIGNAVSAYFMIFVSGMFLLNKQNPLLNNIFVKQHTKSALLIHLGFLMSYFIFISYGIGASISIGSVALNYIFASILCILLLGVLLFGAFKASKGDIFGIGEIIKVSKVQGIVDVNNENTSLDERQKLDIILSYIPFISFYFFPKHKDNIYVIHGSRGTLFFTIITILLYNLNHINFVIFLTLLYTIYVVFIGLNLFTTGNILQIRFAEIFSPEHKFRYTHALCRYLKNYIGGNDLQSLHSYQKEITEEEKNANSIWNDKILSLPNLKFPKGIIYIPLINLFYIFLKENKYSTHIRNGIIISILFILVFIFLKITSFSYGFLYLFAIISLYGIGYIHSQPVYKMPYVYMFYDLYRNIIGSSKEANAKYNVEKNVTLKVEKK